MPSESKARPRRRPPQNALLPLSVIVLTKNEEVNIGPCLDSLVPLFDEVFVVDSGSDDRTVEIAKAKGAKVVFHAWPGYPQQWNWALQTLPTRNEFLCIFAADERATKEFVSGIGQALREHPDVDLILTRSRYIFMGRWIRYGGYFEKYNERVGRKGRFRFDERAVGEHAIVDGKSVFLDIAYVHEDLKPVAEFLRKHLRYAELEAEELSKPRQGPLPRESEAGTPAQRRIRFLRDNVYLRAPFFLRGALLFAYRYLLKQGFRDGLPGLVFHGTQSLLLNFLVDTLLLERKLGASKNDLESAAQHSTTSLDWVDLPEGHA